MFSEKKNFKKKSKSSMGKTDWKMAKKKLVREQKQGRDERTASEMGSKFWKEMSLENGNDCD